VLPSGIGKDAAGNLYVADYLGQTIRRIDSSGNITTVAGTAFSAGNTGDGGPASAALINRPLHLVIDGAGNLIFTDSSNNRIRKIDIGGIIHPVAGSLSGSAASTGLAFIGDGGPASAAYLFGPSGLALDGLGNLYISEFSAGRIRKIDSSGTISTIAGGGGGALADGATALGLNLQSPLGMVFSPSGDLYFVSAGANSIWRIDASGLTWRVAGSAAYGGGFSGDGGPALSALLQDPQEIVSDGQGDYFFSDENNGRVREIDSQGTILSVAGGGASLADGIPGLSALLSYPTGVFLDSLGSIFVSEGQGYRIRELKCAAPVATPAPTSPPSTAPSQAYTYPSPLPRGVTPFCVYTMREAGDVQIRVWNAAGDLVAQVFDSARPAGTQQSSLRLNYFAPGVYYYRVSLSYQSGATEQLSAQKFAVLP
jgi:hypothetical protein